MTQFVALSGLPRSGSTLLAAILHQNPAIHAEGNSAVCQMMWDLQQSTDWNCREQLLANRRYTTAHEIISAIPQMYYAHTNRPVVIDKCRSWTLPANQDMWRRYIDDKPKTIVLTRPIDEIVQSFETLYERNQRQFDAAQLLREDSEPLMRSLRGVEWAKQTNAGEFLFIDYHDLIANPTATLNDIYTFIGLQPYEHDLLHIVNEHAEDDAIYGLQGMHDIRPTIDTVRTH